MFLYIHNYIFQWDARKASRNQEKHGITFNEATTVFDDPDALLIDDRAHSSYETRTIRVGRSSRSQTLTVVYTLRRLHGVTNTSQTVTRIISARQASKAERVRYVEAVTRS